MRSSTLSCTLVVLSGLVSSSWSAATFGGVPQGDIVIKLETVASGLVAPLSVTHAGDGSGRLFIVEQSGQIRIVEDDVLLPAPFLDIADLLPDLGGFFDERGLLGLAFHPNYSNNGRFFIRHSIPREGDPDEPCNDPDGFIVGCHSEVVAEYSVSDDDANLADPDSGVILFSVDEPQFNHDGGDVAFGPDGMLYFALGDGGGAHDGLADMPPSHGPTGHGQNIETALGAMLRIDVDSPPQDPLLYAIPADNPFVGGPGLDEIYAYGMRNPYRFSFDNGPGGDGALYLADVGQNLFEEVNIVVNGGNYGWVIREGFHCFDPFDPTNPPNVCPDTGPLGEPLIDPIAAYSHPGSGFDPEGGITVIGGFVYRGSRSPGLDGTYVFGDFAQAFVQPTGRLYYLAQPSPGELEIQQFQIGVDNDPYGLFLKGFGEDEDGEIYTCGSTALAPFGDTGVVQRIVTLKDPSLIIKQGACPAPINPNGNGLAPMVLTGTEDFDVAEIQLGTLLLSRADDEDNSVAPLANHTRFKDLNHPFLGDGPCSCNADQSADGITDLSLKFSVNEMVNQLGLTPGESIVLSLRGELADGSAFTASDCILVMPAGDVQPANATFTANVSGSLLEVTQLDLNFDSDGFANFSRSYYEGSSVTVTAPLRADGRRFLRWQVDGVLRPAGMRTIELTVTNQTTAVALYRRQDRIEQNPGPRQQDNPLE
jgi:glucose/arabinose dehydrogenase